MCLIFDTINKLIVKLKYLYFVKFLNFFNNLKVKKNYFLSYTLLNFKNVCNIASNIMIKRRDKLAKNSDDDYDYDDYDDDDYYDDYIMYATMMIIFNITYDHDKLLISLNKFELFE